jgi:hypothetical protein
MKSVLYSAHLSDSHSGGSFQYSINSSLDGDQRPTRNLEHVDELEPINKTPEHIIPGKNHLVI